MDRVFRIRTFERWMRKVDVSDEMLLAAVKEMSQGLVDAELGGSLVKKRLPLPGKGKRGGARTIVATRLAGHWFFLYGFRKNERDNIGRKELLALQEVARQLLSFDDRQILSAIMAGQITEVYDDDARNQ